MPPSSATRDSTPRFFLGRNGRPIRCGTCESPLFLVDVYPMFRWAVRVEVACANHCDRICPKCGGEAEFSDSPWEHSRFKLIGNVECDDCGWAGRIPDPPTLTLWTRVAERYERARQKEEEAAKKRTLEAGVRAGLVCPRCRVHHLEHSYARLTKPSTGIDALAHVRSCRTCGPIEILDWIDIYGADAPPPRPNLPVPRCQSCDMPIKPTGQCGCS